MPPSNAANVEPFEQHRGLLFSVAYRMLGSVGDAEDVVQDAWMRWSTSDEEVREPAAYLVRIVTRLSIDALKSARVRRESYVGLWLPEPLPTGDDSDPPLAMVQRRELLSLGALTMIERLNPTERAVLVLHEALGFTHNEIADAVGTSAAASRQILTRARRRLGDDSQRRPADPAEHRALLDALVAAVDSGDLTALSELFDADVELLSDGGGRVRAALRPIAGRDKVVRLLVALRGRETRSMRARMVEVNGEAALVTDHETRPYTLVTVDSRGGRITRLFLLLNPDKLARVPAPEAS